jgi:hypothetical protein
MHGPGAPCTTETISAPGGTHHADERDGGLRVRKRSLTLRRRPTDGSDGAYNHAAQRETISEWPEYDLTRDRRRHDRTPVDCGAVAGAVAGCGGSRAGRSRPNTSASRTPPLEPLAPSAPETHCEDGGRSLWLCCLDLVERFAAPLAASANSHGCRETGCHQPPPSFDCKCLDTRCASH